MIYFYSSSYQALLLGLCFAKEKEVIFITHTEGIVKTCDYFKHKCILHKKHKLTDFVFHFIQVKKRINSILNNIGDNPLYFSHYQINIFCILLAYKHKRSGGKVYFLDFEQEHEKADFAFSVKYLKEKLFSACIYAIYHIKLIVKRYGDYYTLGLEREKLSSSDFKIKDYKKEFNNLLRLDLPELNYSNLDSIYLYQPIDKFIYENSKDELYKYLSKKKINFKPHPRVSNDFLSSYNLNEVDLTFLPFEIFAKSVKKAVISINSAALIGASKINPKVRIISVIELLQWKDLEYRDLSKKYLSTHIKGVYFPKTYKELEQLIF